jgi:hypothetical protein
MATGTGDEAVVVEVEGVVVVAVCGVRLESLASSFIYRN